MQVYFRQSHFATKLNFETETLPGYAGSIDIFPNSNVGDQNIYTDWQLVSEYLKLTIFGFVRIITEKTLALSRPDFNLNT